MRSGLILLALVLQACGGPSNHELLVKDGRAAESREQWLEASQAYERACQLKPDNKSACVRAQEMRDYAIEIRSYRAHEHCRADELAQCLEVIAPVRNIKSQHQQKVHDVVARASVLAIRLCTPREAAADALPQSVAELRCLQRWREALWEVGAYRDHFAQRSRAASSALARRAEALPPQTAGARMSYLQAAQCLAPLSAQRQQSLQAAASAFTSRSATRLQLGYTVKGTAREAPGTCMDLSSKLGRGLFCGDGSDSQTPLVLNAEVFSIGPRWQRSHEDRRQSARYLAGTETVENPEYNRARLEYELADRRLAEIERDTREREQRCNDTQSQADCSAFESIQRTRDQRRDERNRAQSRFHQEPATITQDVYRDHAYTVRTHRWTSPFRASIKVGSRPSAAEITNIVYTDSEQSGFAEAGIRADSFEPPGQNYFRDESSRWLSERIEFHVLEEMKRRAHRAMDTCATDRIDCWATASYWLGQLELGLPLLAELAPRAEPQAPALRCTASLL